MRSLLFHHSWKNEADSLASDIKLDKNIIYAIKSTEESGSKRTSSTPDHVRRALIILDIPTKDIKLRIYSDFLNIFREEFEHRFFKKWSCASKMLRRCYQYDSLSKMSFLPGINAPEPVGPRSIHKLGPHRTRTKETLQTPFAPSRAVQAVRGSLASAVFAHYVNLNVIHVK